MANIIDGFKATILIMLFYSFSINMIVYGLPEDSLNYFDMFQSEDIDIQEINDEIDNSLSRQTDIPVLDVGALVFYSGNILIDLILNFMFAIPEMIGFLFAAIFYIVSINVVFAHYIELFVTATYSAMFVIGIIQLVSGIRSGQTLF